VQAAMIASPKSDMGGERSTTQEELQGQEQEQELACILELVLDENKSSVECKVREEGAVVALSSLVIPGLGQPERRQAEQQLREGRGHYWRVLGEIYRVSETLQKTRSHRRFIRKVYTRFLPLFPHLKEATVEAHDLSKFSFIELVGYTDRWVWGRESPLWLEALEHHYTHNSHHPQHSAQDEEMEDTDLQESVVDMLACSWERREGGREDLSAHSLASGTEDPRFLARYLPGDRHKVVQLLRRIKDSNL